MLAVYVAAETSNEDVVDAFGGVLSQKTALVCCTSCAKVAMETIDLAYERRSRNPSAVGPVAAWWYNVLFVYSAATVLVAAKICPTIMTEIPEAAIVSSMQKAMEILKHYSTFDPGIEQLIAVLYLLFNVLPEHYVQPRIADATAMGADGARASSAVRQEQSLRNGRGYFNESDTLLPRTGTNLEPVAFELSLDNLDFDPNFEFTFDNNDLSWLNTMPFDL